MKEGLVIGKFMPLHKGHIELIHFAKKNCDRLNILLAAKKTDSIPGITRKTWLQATFGNHKKIRIHYTEENLPDASYSSREVSRVWAGYLKKKFANASLIFSSEKYGDYLAEYMQITHKPFDPVRLKTPVSGTMIRENPLIHWEFIPEAVRPFFLKRVCVYGPESTGKSHLTKRLANYYKTSFVQEMARMVLKKRHVVYEDIPVIAEKHAAEILKKEKKANRVLFSDTDIITTRIYSEHYFHKIPFIPSWIEDANRFDLYLFCDIDVPWVPDSQRDAGHLREYFKNIFQQELEKKGYPYALISGNWQERFDKAVKAIGLG